MITEVGTTTDGQSTSNQTLVLPAIADNDFHLILQVCKSGIENVAATPSGYTEIATMTGSGGGLVLRAAGKILSSSDTGPTLSQGGIGVLYNSTVLRGVLNDTIANIIAATTPTAGSVSSATVCNYATTGLPNDDSVAVMVWGTYGTSGAGTLGTPTTLSAPTQLADTVGTNMKAALWMDLQTTATSIAAGNLPITGGTTQTNRSLIFTLRAAPTTVTGAGRMMMMGVG